MSHAAQDPMLVPLLCSNCGYENPADHNFCGKCGTRLTARKESPQPAPASPAFVASASNNSPVEISKAERRQITVMFCDLVGSTQLSAQLDPEDFREVVRDYQQAGAEAILAYHGHIAQYLGDGLLVYFGFPQAHENDAQYAVRAGLGLVEAIKQLNERLQQRLEIRLAVRIGIHTGPVVVGEMGGGGRYEQLALGQTPNVAARLQSLAQPDEVLLSEATYKLVQDHFEYRNCGTHALKGVMQPMQVYQVLRAHTRRGRTERVATQEGSPLFGREHELAQLLDMWQRAKNGAGCAALLKSEAGVGKSRLQEAFKERLAGEACWIMKGGCSSYEQERALHPISEMLEQSFGLAPEDSEARRMAALAARLERYGVALKDIQPLFAGAFSAPHDAADSLSFGRPQLQKRKALLALLQLMQALAREKPLLFFLEDLHWADAATMELLELLLENIKTSALMMCLTFRPSFNPPWPQYEHVAHFALTPLPANETMAMINFVARGKTLPREMMQQLVSKTDGVPLFVEELTKMVLESGLLIEREDRFELSGPLPPLAIPATLHDSLMARLDRLSSIKEVVQFGAAIGREFSYELLQLVSQLEHAVLQNELARLVEAGLLQQQGLPPASKYSFKHALIQDTAYQTLLKSTRQLYHARIAQVLAERFPRILSSKPELIAYHYSAARLGAQAVPYWHHAGQLASRRAAYDEAIVYYKKALELVRELPESDARMQQELDILIALGAAYVITTGYAAQEVEQTYARARALAAQEDGGHLYPALLGLSRFYLIRGDFQSARELAEQTLRLAATAHDAALLVESHFLVGTSLFHLGELEAARANLEQGIAFYEVQQHRAMITPYGHDSGVSCLCYLARILWFQGYPEQALRRSMEALVLARELAHPFSLTMALTFAALVSQLRQEAIATRTLAEEVFTLSNEQGYAFYQAMAKVLHGWAVVELHQEEAGIAEIEEGLSVWRATGAQLFRPHLLALLAESCANLDRAEEGLQALREALSAAQVSGKRFYEAELHRLHGLLLMKLGAPAEEVERSFYEALEIARDRQAKSLELRAAIGLCSYHDNRPECKKILREIYDWFKEGNDTLDLQLAAAMLKR